MSRLKDDLIAALEEIGDLLELANENEFKVRAFRKGAEALVRSGFTQRHEFEEVASGKVKIPGIGDGLKKSMHEFLETGVVSERERVLEKVPQAILDLVKLPGLGPKKARMLYDELDIKSVGELEYACQENRLLTLKGFGHVTQKKILQSIERMKKNQGRFLIHEAQERLQGVLKYLSRSWHFEPIGELGRWNEVVTKFSLAVWGGQVEDLKKLPWLGRPKDEKILSYPVISGLLQMGEETLLTEFVVLSRAFKNLSLFEQQILMSSGDFRQSLESSNKIFMFEGEPWEWSWLESEWSHRGPKKNSYRRQVHGHVRGVFHNHTVASDGSATLEEMVLEAQRLGYEYIGISDHSQTAVYAHGLKAEELKKQREEIKALQKKVSIRIFHGVESDILKDGELDYPDEILKELDFVVASIHSRFQLKGEAMTQRLVRAVENPLVTFWGHPTGRLLLGRDPYEFDWDAVFKAAKKSGVAFELNANPHRLDVDWRLGERLENYQVPICINPDAHSTEGLSDSVWGEAMAEKAMLSSQLILNLKSVDEMEKYLFDRKKGL